MAEGWVKWAVQGDTRILIAGGDWHLPSLERLDRELQAPTATPARHLKLVLDGIDRLDTAGAWLLVRTQLLARAAGAAVSLEQVSEQHRRLLDLVAHGGEGPPPAPPTRPRDPLAPIALIGARVFQGGHEALSLLSFFGQILATLGTTLLRPRRLRLAALVRQLELVGLRAMPIVGLLSFLIGIVLAYQGADQLRRFGAEIFAIDLLGVSVLRELGILLTAIIIAGRSGSAFTAEIGAMQVNEEVDALRTLGLDPVEVLVLPRLLALVIALPLLAFYASAMALIGGGLVIMLAIELPLSQFLTQLADAVTPKTLWAGLIKAPVFAFLIAMVGCFQGLSVTRSATSVGLLTTKSVVVSIFLVILTDALFSILFVKIGF